MLDLWLINITIIFFFNLFSKDIISFSFLGSNPLVASSNTKTLGFRYRALAIAILCFCPPEILDALSPITVSKPLGRLLINSFKSASSITLLILN